MIVAPPLTSHVAQYRDNLSPTVMGHLLFPPVTTRAARSRPSLQSPRANVLRLCLMFLCPFQPLTSSNPVTHSLQSHRVLHPLASDDTNGNALSVVQ